MRYKAAVFDLDGTILDTLEDLKDSLNYSLSEAGLPGRTLEETRRFVGNGVHKLIERAVPQGTAEAEIDRIFADFKSYYKDHCAVKTKPYEGIRELLVQLREKGCLTAVVSNKVDFAVKSLCEFYFPDLFDVTVGEREGIRRKPYPDSLLEVMKTLRIKAKETLYIGDSEVDVQTAKNGGTDCLAVDWGFRSRETLEEQGAKIIVSSPEEIWKYIVGEP